MTRRNRVFKLLSSSRPMMEAIERRMLLSAVPAGQLDPSFGNDGLVNLPVSTNGDYFNSAVAVQPNGDIIEVGNNVAVRLLPDGQLDTTFGTGGSVTLQGNATRIFIHSDGTILFAGSVLEELTNAGAIDPAFASGTGYVVLPAGNGAGGPPTGILDAAQVDDGTIYAVSPTTIYAYNTDGSVDTGFASAGSAALGSAYYSDIESSAIAINPKGDIDLALGAIDIDPNDEGFSGYVVEQMLPSGVIDSSFGTGGFAAPQQISGDVDHVAITVAPDGTIYQAGDDGYYDGPTQVTGIAAISPTGAVEIPAADNSSLADNVYQGGYYSLTAQSDDKLLVVGFQYDTQYTTSIYVDRFEPAGAKSGSGVDLSFAGPRSYGTTGQDAGQAIAVSPDGDLIIAGLSGYSPNNSFTVTAIGSGSVANVSAQLTGSGIGTAGSYRSHGTVGANAFDGSTATYFDSPDASGDWTGLDLGSEYTINQIDFSPRQGYEARMVGGTFQASNSAGFSSGVVNLFTVTLTPGDGLTDEVVTAPGTYRYLRYIGPANSYCDISEAQFFGSPANQTLLSGTVIGTTGSYKSQGNTGAKAFDGNLNTFFDAPTASGSWTGLDLGSIAVIRSISYAPRSGWASRMDGGVFQASNSATFSTGVVNLFTVSSTPATGVLTTVVVSNTSAYRYVRYIGPANSYCDIAEAEFFGTILTRLTGTVIGTTGSYHSLGNTIANVFDGNISTYFDGPDASGDWVGQDLGTAQVVTQVSYAPRAGLATRMVGGEIQASNSANFSTGVVTLYTITAAPTAGVLTTQSFTNLTAYRYYRYIGPANGYCNIAELEFIG